jgi:hypothetical protein
LSEYGRDRVRLRQSATLSHNHHVRKHSHFGRQRRQWRSFTGRWKCRTSSSFLGKQDITTAYGPHWWPIHSIVRTRVYSRARSTVYPVVLHSADFILSFLLLELRIVDRVVWLLSVTLQARKVLAQVLATRMMMTTTHLKISLLVEREGSRLSSKRGRVS